MEIMQTRLEIKDIYTVADLKGIAGRCDWFINGNQFINITNTDAPKTIFLTGKKGTPGIAVLVGYLLPKINNEFVLIIASEDYTFPTGKGDVRFENYKYCQAEIQQLFDSKWVTHMFVENMDTKHAKMSPIPLGLLSSTNIVIDLESSEYNSIDFSKRTNLCFCAHRTRSDDEQWKDRVIVNNLCITKWDQFVSFYGNQDLSHSDFIDKLRNSIFCLCIHGGGYDPCPRFFEAILHGTIPIIQHSPLDEVFSKFPVVFIDELTESALSESMLLEKVEELREFYEGPKRKEVLQMLTMDYWWKIITDKIKIKPSVITNNTQYFQTFIEFLYSNESPERQLPCLIYYFENYEIREPIILYNCEQMTISQELANVVKIASNPNVKEVWDYSLENCRILKMYGIEARHVPLISPKVYVDQIKTMRDDLTIDVGFCGDLSERCLKILNELMKEGFTVHCVTHHGTERYKRLVRCRVIVNIHSSDDSTIFEQTRCDIWLRAGVPVVSETSVDDDPRCINTPYNSIVETVKILIQNL